MSEQAAAIEDYLDGDALTYHGWSRALRDGHLLGLICGECGAGYAGVREGCAHCSSRELSPTTFPTEGEVYSEARVEIPPAGFKPGYQVAVIDLGPARVMGRIDQDSEVDIGDAVILSGVGESEERPYPIFSPAG